MDQLSRRTMMVGGLGVAGGLLAACNPASNVPTNPATTPAATSTPSASASAPADTRPRWPLTGVLMADPAEGKHAAVAVMVPDNKNEHPQRGIEFADLVFVISDGYVDKLGQAATRLMPVFHSSMPTAGCGPVRSVRPVDVPIMAPMTGIIGNASGGPWVIEYHRQHAQYVDGVLDYMSTKGTGSYSIDQSRVYRVGTKVEYDRAVVCYPIVLAKQTSSFADGPASLYFPFATGDAQASTATGVPATRVVIPWKRADTYNMTYDYDQATNTYLRSEPWGPHVTSSGTRVAVDNILAIRAEQTWVQLLPGPGGLEPNHEIVNSEGSFVYANGGKVVGGHWSKGAVNDPWAFVLDNGKPLVMAPGRTFVEFPTLDANIQVTA